MDSLISRDLDTIVITTGRIATPYLRLPASVTSVDVTKTSRFISHTDLSETLQQVPGLFTLNGQNYAQDLRISLRGFGARSAFGIRGIKLIVDGIPETTPDGQGQLDNISVTDISSVQVLQGTSSSQYGNASGGLIEIKTFDDEPYELNGGIRIGSFGLSQYNLSTAQELNNTLIQLSGTHQRSNGYREHSRLRQTNILSKLTHQWGKNKLSFLGSLLASPVAEDPGGINLEQATQFPQSARDRNLSFDAGESINHWKTSLRWQRQLSTNIDMDVRTFYSGRSFDGRLPFANGGSIDLNRKYGGVMTQLNHQKISSSSINKLGIGMELLSQRDNRERFVNNEGERGDLTLSQIEKFDAFGIYLIDQWNSQKWTASGSIRYDINAIAVEDKFVSNGDDSGERDLNTFNYSIGLSYNYGDNHTIFSNYSTSFETPTLSELSSNPSGVGGFNNSLNPMKAKTFELGIKGQMQDKLSYSIVFFTIRSNDELIPFELDDFPGRTFFRNAGSTSRKGIETNISLNLADELQLVSSYSYSNFQFVDYVVDGTDLSNGRLPGIPKHSMSSALIWKPNKSFVKLSSQYFSSIYVTDENSVSVDNYKILNLRIGHDFSQSKFILSPFVAINNLGDQRYFDNLRLNAFGSRYYEPAANFNWQIGVSFRIK